MWISTADMAAPQVADDAVEVVLDAGRADRGLGGGHRAPPVDDVVGRDGATHAVASLHVPLDRVLRPVGAARTRVDRAVEVAGEGGVDGPRPVDGVADPRSHA